MATFFGKNKRKILEVWHLIARNVFLLINGIIFAVAFLLVDFGNTKEGIFLGVIIFINIILGVVQDIHAWLTLERLHLLTVVRVTRLNNDGTTIDVLPEDLTTDDKVVLHLGDQVPCDGTVLSEKSLEVSESLITGESNSSRKEIGGRVLAGSIVTSGTGVLKVETPYNESRIAKMTAKIKRYTENLSPIQMSVNYVVKYSGYVLLAVIAYVVYRGSTLGEAELITIKSIGALASTIVPQGLVIATTLLFAYGATHMYRRHVLLQDVNATEKLGRIKNLCLDKTGTLTENVLVVEEMHVPPGTSQEEARYLTSTYLCESGDSSQTVHAIEKHIGSSAGCEVSEVMSFSSERRYGGVSLKPAQKNESVLAGAPDAFLPHITDKYDRQWLDLLLETHSGAGKRLMCIVRSKGSQIPHDLTDADLSIVAVFILNNNLRPGIRDTIHYFQKRGITIRIISGDNPDTVRAIASKAGVDNTEKVITGMEMEQWNESDYTEKARNYFIFARIKPEQKEKIIKALKKDGFTAMVGDGANDALAIKKADLGIAMFDGAPATRQLASVVLTKNSFTELPGGVKMADSIIKNIEIFASIFFNQTFAGFFFFVWISILGYSYPITPLNVTLTNYFTVGLPGVLISYWAIKPKEKPVKENMDSFLKRVLPFPFVAAIIQSFCVVGIYVMNKDLISADEMRTLMVISFAAVGFIFFMLAPRVYEGYTERVKMFQFL
ncbi:MAG: HAD-IC family P-type ATPase, partial [Candidatus Pacebacteria bacterium]|nr:HAD-IC family P-type ATPase [Candidatus Paceibacterota bacterium]